MRCDRDRNLCLGTRWIRRSDSIGVFWEEYKWVLDRRSRVVNRSKCISEIKKRGGVRVSRAEVNLIVFSTLWILLFPFSRSLQVKYRARVHGIALRDYRREGSCTRG